MEDSSDDCEMELIDLQADMDTKREYSENSLQDFHELYVCGKFPNSSRPERRMIPYLVASTAVCNYFKDDANQMPKSAV